MNQSLYEYYRCPEQAIPVALTGPVSEKSGYFRLGQEVLYGSLHCGDVAAAPDDVLRDVSPDCTAGDRQQARGGLVEALARREMSTDFFGSPDEIRGRTPA